MSSFKTLAELEPQDASASVAEEAVIGAILANPSLITEAASILTPHEFSTESMCRLYTAMLEMQKRDVAIDLVTIRQFFNIEEVGGVARLADMITGVPQLDSCAEYCKIVTDKAKRRWLNNALMMAISQLQDNEESESVVAECQMSLDRIVSGGSSEATDAASVSVRFLKGFFDERQAHQEGRMMSYGLECLDLLTGGIRKGEYTIIAGRSGQGKSALARQIAFHVARSGFEVCFFTPEVTPEQLWGMLVPLDSLIPYFTIKNPWQASDSTVREITATADRLAQLPIHVIGKSDITIAELCAKAKMHIRKGAKLVVVDYLQLVDAKAQSARERVNIVSSGLRNLAKSTGVPVIALSQLSRPNDKTGAEKPTMHHLYESGQLEQDAFNVFMLFRPQENGEFTGYDEIIIGKQRFGESGGYVPVRFDKRRVCYAQR